MKKSLLTIAVAVTGMVSAQNWSEDFSTTTGIALPAGWKQNNVDNNTVSSSLNAYSFGTNAWVTRNWATAYPDHGRVVMSTSWYNPAGTSNDWLITPQFTVPNNSILDWDAIATDPSYKDGYQVKLSTTGTLTTDFTTNLMTVAAENAAWTTRGLSLNAYAGQQVYIAFVNNSNDKYLLLLDNIRVHTPPANDGEVLSITGIQRYKAGAGTQNITGVFRSMGYTAANSTLLHYSVNNGPASTTSVNFGTALNYGQTANFTFTVPANVNLGTNNIKVWVTSVNQVAETNLLNDSLATVSFVASKSVARAALIEEWSSSTCGPCAALNVSFDPLLNNNSPNTGGSVNVVKYQVNWPNPSNDPSYNAHSRDRVEHYNINAAPTAITNGRTEMTAHSQGEIDAAKAEPAWADMTATLTAMGNTATPGVHTLTASADITPWVTIMNESPLRVFQVLLQKEYNYQAGTTSQKNYFHVMRKMNPNGWGSPVTVSDGTLQTVSWNYTSTPVNIPTTAGPASGFSHDFWTKTDITYEYVVFIQDTISNDILQSASRSATVSMPAPPTQTSTVGMDERAINLGLSVFPNPSTEFVMVGIHLDKSSSVKVTITDIQGRIVYNNVAADVESGNHKMKVNTSGLASGNYMIAVETDETVVKEKLVVTH
jgi:hypothetical protein